MPSANTRETEAIQNSISVYKLTKHWVFWLTTEALSNELDMAGSATARETFKGYFNILKEKGKVSRPPAEN